MSWIDEEFKKDKIAVVGDMLELGESEDTFHAGAGRHFAGLNFCQLITVGIQAEKIGEGAIQAGFPRQKVHFFSKALDAGIYLKEQKLHNTVLLFKASRGIGLEKALEEFCSG
jgi:UDP-N-acetylmuramyl pentapeptide synthase